MNDDGTLALDLLRKCMDSRTYFNPADDELVIDGWIPLDEGDGERLRLLLERPAATETPFLRDDRVRLPDGTTATISRVGSPGAWPVTVAADDTIPIDPPLTVKAGDFLVTSPDGRLVGRYDAEGYLIETRTWHEDR